MGWLDPADCVAAEECLERGHSLEAARLLLESPHRGHRAARRLLLTISEQLVQEARGAVERGDVVVAAETIECAGQCAKLQDEAAALRERIIQQRDQLQEHEDWHRRRLDQAKAWARQGRLGSAISLLRPVSNEAEADRLKLDLQQQLSRFRRCLERCRDHIEKGDLVRAREQLDKARRLNASDPQVIRLEKEVRQAQPEQIACGQPAEPSHPITSRRTSFGVANYALVLLQHEVVIGTPRGEIVQVPIQARLHGRHALITRDGHRYRLIPFGDCRTCINGQPVVVPMSQELQDGDLIELSAPQCRWTFRLPVPGSTTALLEQATPVSPCVRTPDGGQFRRVVLLDDVMQVSRQGPAHLVVRALPCECLTLRWRKAELTAEARGGRLFVEASGHPPDGPSQTVFLPSHLVIYSDAGAAEWLNGVLRGRDSPDVLRLAIRDPFQAEPLQG